MKYEEVYLRIAVYLNVENIDEAVTIAELFKPWREKISQVNQTHQRMFESPMLKRQQKILNAIIEQPVKIGTLYRSLNNRRIYVWSFKSFQRDVHDLIIKGKMTGIRQQGAEGNTTIVGFPGMEVLKEPIVALRYQCYECGLGLRNHTELKVHYTKEHSKVSAPLMGESENEN